MGTKGELKVVADTSDGRTLHEQSAWSAQSKYERREFPMRQFTNKMPKNIQGQLGITGLETAIVLIAFVVVSSVFAFAALSTGLFSSDKSKETINAGLSEARGTLEMRGSVIVKKGTTNVDEITIQVSNAAGGEAVDVTPGATVIQYLDSNQSVTLASTADFTSTALGNADSDKLVEPGELYEIKIIGLEAKLTTGLGADTKFSIEVKPPKGAVVHVERRTPVLLENFMDLG